MNPVVIAVLVMLVLSLLRINVVIALVIGALAGGMLAGLGVLGSIEAFNGGLGGGATIALSYAMLGAFAVAISRSGITDVLAQKVIKSLGKEATALQQLYFKGVLLGIILLAAVSSQNLIPVHIAFIPILIPPLLHTMATLKLDRRLVACTLAFGLTATYMLLPVGFGGIFLNNILLKNIVENGVQVTTAQLPVGMAIPVFGMFLGLLVAGLVSYRKPREYSLEQLLAAEPESVEIKPLFLVAAVGAIVLALWLQLYSDSIILGALAGLAVFVAFGVVKPDQTQDVFARGIGMMGMIGFIMIAASGFAEVMKATGGVGTLVSFVSETIGQNRSLAALLMLVVGLLITMGIGSSFSTIPIIAAIYVPMCMEFGFSPLATIALVGTAAALGDAGSPASDTTLGPTSGLNIDGQHDHIWDTVVPTFIHFNIPLILFGWVAAMVL
ncbi:Na+/H+ antiporter family protein [Sulfurospirillum sp. T05]|uniref:Na+/H+ antiporter family protein n=1 Tax=Sulfurospirillum tamanense TaxID=2813362 RepID=A0ABS2WTK3_9BACT|nr:Na+/H+ antiporter family protein [Sulfurospirillum tamanensis]MBN2964975.1 Na+/H+ antiporter family protein [Sulfurospirillum tamanensis]